MKARILRRTLVIPQPLILIQPLTLRRLSRKASLNTLKTLRGDEPDRMLRYYLGDLIIPLRGFQSAPTVGGIGISKDFSLQPYATIRPYTSTEVIISRPSTVEVFVNGALVETLRIQPGPYDFRQTVLNHGINNVRIRIRNDIGEEKWIDFDMFYSGSGLKKGLSQYSFNLGFLREKEGNHYEYDSKSFISSFFYRRGISGNHTLGGYFQTAPSQLMFGLESDWSSSLGNINTNFAVSRTPLADLDYAAQILYYYYNNNPLANPYHRSWRASVEYTGRRFARINEPDPDKAIAWLFTQSVSQDITDTLVGSLSASYDWTRSSSGQRDSYVYSGSLIKRLTPLARLSFTLSKRRAGDSNEREWRALINLTINSSKRRHTLNNTYNTRENATGLNWQYKSPNSRLKNMLTVQFSDDNKLDFSERLTYSGYRGDVSVTHYHEEPRESGSYDRTNLAVNTALVFVDGQFGWTRTVNNSFAIIETNDILKDYTIGINRRQDGSFQGANDIFGPAAITNLTPYRVYDFKLEIPDLPIGYETNGFEHTLLPSYKSGFLLNVIGKKFILVRGRFVDERQAPLKYLEGNAVSLDDPSLTARSFFTNKNGVFTIYSMVPGRFEIRLKSKKWKPLTIKIPEKCEFNLCKLDTIVVEGADSGSEGVAGKEVYSLR